MNQASMSQESSLLNEIKSTINNTIDNAIKLNDNTSLSDDSRFDHNELENSQNQKTANSRKNKLEEDTKLSPKKMKTDDDEEDIFNNNFDLNNSSLLNEDSHQNKLNKNKLDENNQDEVDCVVSKYFKEPKLIPENESANKMLIFFSKIQPKDSKTKLNEDQKSNDESKCSKLSTIESKNEENCINKPSTSSTTVSNNMKSNKTILRNATSKIKIQPNPNPPKKLNISKASESVWERLKHSEHDYVMCYGDPPLSSKKIKKKSPKLNSPIRVSALTRMPVNISSSAKKTSQHVNYNSRISDTAFKNSNNELIGNEAATTSSFITTSSAAKSHSIVNQLSTENVEPQVSQSSQQQLYNSVIKNNLYLDKKIMLIVDEELKNELKIVDDTIKTKIKNNITRKISLTCNKAIYDVFKSVFNKVQLELNERQTEIHNSNFNLLNSSLVNDDLLDSSLIDKDEILCSSFVTHEIEKEDSKKPMKKNNLNSRTNELKDQKIATKSKCQSPVRKPIFLKPIDGVLTTYKKNGEVIKERLSTGEIIEIFKPEDQDGNQIGFENEKTDQIAKDKNEKKEKKI